MIDLKDMTIAEIVTEDISKAAVFKKHNLDFCCGGDTTIENACKKANIRLDDVLTDLLYDSSNNVAPNLDFKHWNAGFLADYIVNVHHSYVTENIEIINEFANKVAHVHGSHTPETIEIADIFMKLSRELVTHMFKEENLLFPAIKAKIEDSNFQYDQTVIEILEDEHDTAGDFAKKIQQLSNNFTPPEWACNTYKALYHKLNEFINDLYQHIHLENNILFYKIRH
jgi:regulator of cell morphogenesis and NO signaling